MSHESSCLITQSMSHCPDEYFSALFSPIIDANQGDKSRITINSLMNVII